ncbi:MAG: CARDB domain-containing protein [Candidatus Micrarchaeaceae archaeon]
MKKEIYFWILLFIAVIGIALYIRLLYQPTLSIVLSSDVTLPSHTYPYQTLYIPITVLNNGHSPIKNMTIGVYVNGNITTYYHVTIPQGKEVLLNFTYAPSNAGNYTIEAIADPGRLYDIIDRAEAQTSINFTVLPAENTTPYLMLPKGNITEEGFAKINSAGYALASDLNATYGITDLKLTSNYTVNKFLDSVLKYVLNYISSLTFASAKYANGSSAYAIWLRGDISPNITNTAALINSIKSTNKSIDNKTVTFIRFSNSTSLCSYYSQGWIKMLVVNGKGTCTNVIQANKTSKISSINTSRFFKKMQIANSISLGNYSLVDNNASVSGTLAYFENVSLIYASIASINRSEENNTCYGLISTNNTDSFCNEYVFANATAKQTGASLIDTRAYIGNYNISVYSLVNTSLLLDQVPINMRIIKGFNITGPSLAFVSGIKNTCLFNTTFACSNVSFYNSTISFRLENLNKTVKLNSITCYMSPSFKSTPVNKTLLSNETTNISATCYENGAMLSGLALNLHLNLIANYTINGKNETVLGTAYIPFS